MATYEDRTPGVHVEEITPAGPIAGAGTGAAAFIGAVARPPADPALGKPVPVTSWTAYTEAFGTYKPGLQLPYALRGFFENGGALAHVLPVKDMTGLDAALDQLTRVADVGTVCLPGVVEAAAQKKAVDHCARMGDRFAILDGAQDPTPLKAEGALQTQRAALVSKDGAYSALYWPWIVISDPTAPAATPSLLTVPPSGHVAGVLARSDNQRGVHKAPANEPLRGALDLGYALNDTEHGKLNQGGVNAIRRFPGRPPLVWGARTLSDEVAWRYINVRRLVSYIEASLLQGLRWAVFEPNNTTLWKGLERSITEFLTRVWQAGALFGRTAKEAFYVKIDEELNPSSVRELGQVVVEIGVAPTRPAEHVVVRLGLWAGGAGVAEG